jgi:hypothetical protein
MNGTQLITERETRKKKALLDLIQRSPEISGTGLPLTFGGKKMTKGEGGKGD